MASARSWALAVAAVALAAPSVRGEGSISVVAAGLQSPHAVAAVRLPSDRLRRGVFFGDLASGGLSIALEDSGEPTVVLRANPLAGATRIDCAQLGESLMLVGQADASTGGRRLEVFQLGVSRRVRLQQVDSPPDEDEAQFTSFGPLLVDATFVHRIAEVGGRTVILRGRHAGGMVSMPRRLPDSGEPALSGVPVAAVLRGDAELTLAIQDGDACRLVFAHVAGSGLSSVVALPLDLRGVRSLRYAPSAATPRLYALAADGLYRLDAAVGEDDDLNIAATKVQPLDNPQSMDFAAADVLYVTRGGLGGDGVELLRIDGDF
ncbi:MAG: hypothetical protein AAGJ46_15850 [Planctomycetota bacterium]